MQKWPGVSEEFQYANHIAIANTKTIYMLQGSKRSEQDCSLHNPQEFRLVVTSKLHLNRAGFTEE